MYCTTVIFQHVISIKANNCMLNVIYIKDKYIFILLLHAYACFVMRSNSQTVEGKVKCCMLFVSMFIHFLLINMH